MSLINKKRDLYYFETILLIIDFDILNRVGSKSQPKRSELLSDKYPEVIWAKLGKYYIFHLYSM